MAPASLAQQERDVICNLFVELGPDSPTLCEGWTTSDLAAHLVVRERRPDSGPGILWPPLAAYTEKVRCSEKARNPWPKLVEKVRQGPPRLLRPVDVPMNTVEFFIHVEDVRRAQPAWEPRAIPNGLADALWARVSPRGMAKKVPATIVITSPGRPEKEAGAGPRLVLAGDPGELMLFASGRQSAARVEITGDERLGLTAAHRALSASEPNFLHPRSGFLSPDLVEPTRRGRVVGHRASGPGDGAGH